MNERRTFLASVAAFAVGLVLGQQENPAPKCTLSYEGFSTEAICRERKLVVTGRTFIWHFALEPVYANDDGRIVALNQKHQGPI